MRDYIDLPRLALSTRQPWAHGIVNGWKDIENRNWRTDVRGPVCIHASKFNKKTFNEDREGYEDTILDLDVPQFGFDDLTFGAIIGVVDIVDCVARSDSPWFFGRYGFVLANARKVEPVEVRGALGFYDRRANLAAPSVLKPEPKIEPIVTEAPLQLSLL